MKTLSIRALSLLLVLGAQIFAQRFTAAVPDVFQAGYKSSTQKYGYLPNYMQSAAMGEKNSLYANIMLLAGSDTNLSFGSTDIANSYNIVSSHGNVLGKVHPINSPNVFISPKGDTIHDNTTGAVVVLDSLNDDKKSATVLFSSLRKLVVMQITLTETNGISYNILARIDMPESIWQAEDFYRYSGNYRRLTLLGSSQNGAYKNYHFATGNPYSKSGAYTGSGRVDFFSLSENSWIFSQYNDIGLASGVNGLFFGSNSYFGTDLVSVGDLDKNGHNDLAVLLPESPQYPYSAIYVFFMDNEWTPSANYPTVLAGNSMPWVENSKRTQDCKGLGNANWGSEIDHLLVSCNSELTSGNILSKKVLIKDLVLNSNGNILNASVFFENEITEEVRRYSSSYSTNSPPLPLKNHKNNLYAVSLITNGPATFATDNSVKIISVMDADYSKNYLLEAGKPEIIVNLDSLFYRSGTTGFSAKTLSGLVQCGIQNNHLLCEGEENAIGSWSTLELSSKSECDTFRKCKRKDTIFVYVRSHNESANTALRIPKSMVVPFFRQINLSNVKSLSYFKNPDLQNTGINWNINGLKLSTVVSNNLNGFSIIPFSQSEGIDTLVFNLSISSATDNYPMYLHVVDTSKILENAVPANPGEDTVWNTAQRKYIALPHSNSSGNIYTYDIAQSSLGTYAEIIGDYLRILRVDVAEVEVAYTENGQVKYRKITLMPEPKALPSSSSSAQEPSSSSQEEIPGTDPGTDPGPSPIATGILNQNFNAIHTGGGLQINGLNGEFELKAYNFKGEEIQRERANAKGSIFIKLRQNTPQIVRIKSGNQKIYLRIVN